jgi:Flp pilus assembly protein TadD
LGPFGFCPNNLAIAYSGLRLYQKAGESFQKSLQLSPNDAAILENIGQVDSILASSRGGEQMR